jgi:hypothetical protein
MLLPSASARVLRSLDRMRLNSAFDDAMLLKLRGIPFRVRLDL